MKLYLFTATVVNYKPGLIKTITKQGKQLEEERKQEEIKTEKINRELEVVAAKQRAANKRRKEEEEEAVPPPTRRRRAISEDDDIAPPPRRKCIDTDEDCRQWAEDGECNNNRAFMKKKCRKSCGFCSS